MLGISSGFLQWPGIMSDQPKLKIPLIDRLKLVVSILRSEKQLIFTLPLGLVATILIVIVRPFVLIRVGFLHSDRIGHFAANHEIFLCEDEVRKSQGGRQSVDLYYMGRIPVCNEQLATMWKRKIRVWNSLFLRPISLIFRSTELLASHVCGDMPSQDRDVNNILDRTTPHLEFTSDEEIKGLELLRQFGVPSGAEYVCFIVRDSAYLKTLYGDLGDYHSYRNADINNFMLAAEELTKFGIYVFRMGSVVEKQFISENSMIIDYASNKLRSDFMDIFLGATCLFCLTTSTGFDAVPLAFRRPLAIVDYVPAGALPTWGKRHIVLTKHHLSESTGNELTLSQILDSEVAHALSSSDYIKAGIQLEENSPTEIADVCIEMYQRLKGQWIDDAENIERQRQFQDVFTNRPTCMTHPVSGVQMHGRIEAAHSSEFLSQNSSYIGPTA
jgi:putative glycosyltransferase (TIGR04372 family)